VSVTFSRCALIIAAVPDDARLRTLLRDRWHLRPDQITSLPTGVLSRNWAVTAGGDRYVARLVDANGRRLLEAGMAAGDHLRSAGIEAGRPVRTLGGALTAQTPAGVLAVLHRVPGRSLSGEDREDQRLWGERLGDVHRVLQGFLPRERRPWSLPDPSAGHLDSDPWLRSAIADAVTAMTRLTVTDRLTYGVMHGDPAPQDFLLDPATGRAGLLDCGAGGTGPLIYDVAAAVIYAGGPDRAAALLDGYLGAGPIGSDELVAALPVALRFRWAVQADRSARDGDRTALAGARAALESMPS
jgi:Ser/Thr protein kinase RdoA (MazF antagonist)